MLIDSFAQRTIRERTHKDENVGYGVFRFSGARRKVWRHPKKHRCDRLTEAKVSALIAVVNQNARGISAKQNSDTAETDFFVSY